MIVRTFDQAGDFVFLCPSYLTLLDSIVCIGGGGGGAAGDTYWTGGGGGGCGIHGQRVVIPGKLYNLTVGAGGLGGVAGGAAPGNGGDSIFYELDLSEIVLGGGGDSAGLSPGGGGGYQADDGFFGGEGGFNNGGGLGGAGGGGGATDSGVGTDGVSTDGFGPPYRGGSTGGGTGAYALAGAEAGTSGGGGGGGWDPGLAPTDGGAGGAGKVIISWDATPGLAAVYPPAWADPYLTHTAGTQTTPIWTLQQYGFFGYVQLTVTVTNFINGKFDGPATISVYDENNKLISTQGYASIADDEVKIDALAALQAHPMKGFTPPSPILPASGDVAPSPPLTPTPIPTPPVPPVPATTDYGAPWGVINAPALPYQVQTGVASFIPSQDWLDAKVFPNTPGVAPQTWQDSKGQIWFLASQQNYTFANNQTAPACLYLPVTIEAAPTPDFSSEAPSAGTGTIGNTAFVGMWGD